MPDADILLTNARVFTANPAQPRAEAVAVRGNQIVFVGSNADAGQWRGPHTRLIDAGQCSLLPGFIDSHFHLLQGSYTLGDIQLDAVESPVELAAAVAEFAAAHPAQEWLVGHGLHYSALPGQTLTRRQLDAVIAERPLVLISYDGHTAWANTEALRRANVLTGRPPVGPNSQIKREADGTAAGELVEPGAYNLVLDRIPPPARARKLELLRQGAALAASLGLTGVHNMYGDAEQMALLTALESQGELPLRVYMPLHIRPGTPPDALAEAVQMRQDSTANVRGGLVKFFMDGVIETYTGLLVDEYPAQPGNRGGALFGADEFNQLAIEADRLGLQMAVHAVGDGAVRRTLDGFAAARQANGPRDSRHRVEHIELIHPDDLPRFAQLGVIASMQPAHAPLTGSDPDPWLRRIEPGRWACSFAWQTIRQAGARLAFGSDWPVASANPLDGLYFARNRQPWAPGLPDQRPSLAEALAGYTRDAAFAEFAESRRGQVRPAFLADLVLLSHDIFAVPPENLRQVSPRLTLCGGQITFESLSG
ncbi:MAG: amidohydrolase [Chloroflexi bacterium]|nr:MAG: amidohydrolase [Chloroflexota bacterium]